MSNIHSLRPQEVSMKASLGDPFKPFPVKVLCVMQIIMSVSVYFGSPMSMLPRLLPIQLAEIQKLKGQDV